jgi:putative transposase
MYKVFKYRLYPSKTQAKRLESVRETCRRWYNECLAERKTAWDERRERISKNDQLRRVKEQKATNPWAAEIHSHVLQLVVTDLDKAFQGFFRRVKAGETPGFPRFKGRNRFSSFGYKEYNNGFKIDGRRLRLSGIGRIAVRWHRTIEGEIKTLRLIEKAGKWYACFTCEAEPRRLPATGQEIGIDVGIASLITTSDGEKIENPHWYRREERKLRVLQRRVSRRKLDGSNRRKAVRQLQRQHERITNRRKDYVNKLVHRLIQQYDRIALEDLRIRNMIKNRHLAKSIMDAAWGYLMIRLHVKAAEAGRVVVMVDSKYTSKTCSGCGHVFGDLTLKDRWITCQCNLSLDRDHNAALNILKRAGHVRWCISSSVDGLPQESAGL